MALYRCGIIVLLLYLLHGTTGLPVYRPATNPPSSLLDTRPQWGVAASEVRLDGHQQYPNKGPPARSSITPMLHRHHLHPAAKKHLNAQHVVSEVYTDTSS